MNTVKIRNPQDPSSWLSLSLEPPLVVALGSAYETLSFHELSVRVQWMPHPKREGLSIGYVVGAEDQHQCYACIALRGEEDQHIEWAEWSDPLATRLSEAGYVVPLSTTTVKPPVEPNKTILHYYQPKRGNTSCPYPAITSEVYAANHLGSRLVLQPPRVTPHDCLLPYACVTETEKRIHQSDHVGTIIDNQQTYKLLWNTSVALLELMDDRYPLHADRVVQMRKEFPDQPVMFHLHVTEPERLSLQFLSVAHAWVYFHFCNDPNAIDEVDPLHYQHHHDDPMLFESFCTDSLLASYPQRLEIFHRQASPAYNQWIPPHHKPPTLWLIRQAKWRDWPLLHYFFFCVPWIGLRLPSADHQPLRDLTEFRIFFMLEVWKSQWSRTMPDWIPKSDPGGLTKLDHGDLCYLLHPEHVPTVRMVRHLFTETFQQLCPVRWVADVESLKQTPTALPEWLGCCDAEMNVWLKVGTLGWQFSVSEFVPLYKIADTMVFVATQEGVIQSDEDRSPLAHIVRLLCFWFEERNFFTVPKGWMPRTEALRREVRYRLCCDVLRGYVEVEHWKMCVC